MAEVAVVPQRVEWDGVSGARTGRVLMGGRCASGEGRVSNSGRRPSEAGGAGESGRRETRGKARARAGEAPGLAVGAVGALDGDQSWTRG